MSVQVITRKLFNFVFFWSEEAIPAGACRHPEPA